MDILGFPVHMLINLIADVGNNQGSITANNAAFILLVSRYLRQILFYHVNNKIRIIIRQFAYSIKQHADQRVHGIIDFKNLCIHDRKKLLIDSIKTLDLCHRHFKVSNRAFYIKAVEFYLGSGLHQNFGNRDSFSRILCNRLYKLLL